MRNSEKELGKTRYRDPAPPGQEAYYPMLEALGQLVRETDDNPIAPILAKRAVLWLLLGCQSLIRHFGAFDEAEPGIQNP